jgi:hypothetical protein
MKKKDNEKTIYLVDHVHQDLKHRCLFGVVTRFFSVIVRCSSAGVLHDERKYCLAATDEGIKPKKRLDA